MKKKRPIVLVVLVFVLLAGISWAEPTSNNRPIDWANSVQMKGVPNLYKVSGDLYRSAHPTSVEAMQNLWTSNLRIRTVVDLRWSESNRDKIRETRLLYEHIPMIGWPLFPKEEQAIKFLQIVTANQKAPILVYCQHGADRTGAMVAVYRIAVQGWSKEKALDEMIEGGFGFHGTRDGNVVQWISRLNIEKIKRKAGIMENAFQKLAHGQNF